MSPLSPSDLPQLLENDSKVKLAGVDVDGILRGKLISKDKFFSIAMTGFGFCSIIFAWDMHDTLYPQEVEVSNQTNGYRDVLAMPDLTTFRRIPWEDNVPFFLVNFFDPDTREPLCMCPRGLLGRMAGRMEKKGVEAMAGAEYEFYHYKTPDQTSAAKFLVDNPTESLPPLTQGMFGYSLAKPVQNKKYYYDIFETCKRFGCDIEGWHTETGPGVYEAALRYNELKQMADRACLFKWTVKSVATGYDITPCFMAKPKQGFPGNSGHMHISLVDSSGKNLFARDHPDPNAPWRDVANLSDLGRRFLAGILDGLPDVMPMVAPTINSYKRLLENSLAPVTVSWGLEHRAASVRLIAPPACEPRATRLEVRVGGADANPYYVLAAIVGLGWRGVERELDIPFSPEGQKGQNPGRKLARNLREATEAFMREGSVAREVFGDGFVNHFGATRQHEVRLFEETVTDWETRRYIETV